MYALFVDLNITLCIIYVLILLVPIDFRGTHSIDAKTYIMYIYIYKYMYIYSVYKYIYIYIYI